MQIDTGTVAVVTGAGGGIGLALSGALAAQGCSVVLADVQPDALAAAEAQIGGLGVDTLAVVTDVSQADEVDSLAAATLERFGRVHIVANNAGVTGGGDPWFGPIESWEWTMGVNFWGVVYGVRAFLPHVIAAGAGHIVNTASMAGLWPAFAPPYDASKHAVVAITENLFHTMQAAGLPVGVSCLCPGWVRTGIIDSDRNWPADLGAPPGSDAARAVAESHVRRAVDEGMPPAVVADLVVEAIRADRYWVLPHPDFVDMAMQRFHTIGDGVNPVPPENVPGLPPRSQMLSEAMEAMVAALDDAPGDEQV